MRIIDISQPVGTGIAVWPGDRELTLEWTLRRDAGDSVNVAGLGLSVHTGTHADGFHHVSDAGARIGDMALAAYLGRCTVVDARGAEVLEPRHVAHLDLARTERILFRTRETVNEREFPGDVAFLSPVLAAQLAGARLRLVGTDAPSIDPLDSKALEAHHILAEAGVANLESLVLTDVPPGDYILVALPLRLVEADSSPVRAVLLDGWP
ncbi:MAG TPA: cyclase family protein [Longimicrobiales bacterium]|nr:cyclase family protein [Longimicrobiales bacterium]